jgi:hypothetical protein
MATVLVIGGVTQTAFVKWGSMTCKLNTLDLILEDPATAPALGNAVTLTNPTWAGTVTSVQSSDPVDRVNGVQRYKVTATNTDTAGASAAPFNLSDAPNGSTTFGYKGLSVSNTQNSDGTTTLHGQCVIQQAGLWPAMTFTLTSSNQGYAATNFSVSNVTVTWPKADSPAFAVEFGDPLVTMSVWANSTAAGILPITTTKITDEAVTTPKIAVGAITADLLAATLILVTLIKSSASGRRWEADAAGIRLYDASEGLLVNIPTDGGPVFVAGQLQASSLVSTGTAELQGTNSLSTASTTTAQAGVQAPSAPPTLAKGWMNHTLAVPTFAGYSLVGISNGYYDTAGGAGGATACFVACAVFWNGTAHAYRAIEWKTSDWSIDRQTTLTGLPTGAAFGGFPFGFTRLGASWYMANVDPDHAGQNTVRKFNRSDGVQTAAVNRTVAQFAQDIKSDGANLLVMVTDGTTTKIETWTSTPAFSATKTLTGLPGSATASSVEYDGTNWWVAIEETSRAYKITISTGAVVANADFPISFIGYAALYWDGTVFHSGTDANTTPHVLDHTSWDWTTASAIYWVTYAWYDDVGTTHETVVGPRQSITMDRRMQLTVGSATIPVGGADDPDKARIYMKPNATDPGAGAFKLQVTDALTTRILTTYNSGGAADGAGTAFPGGTGALLQSAGTGWLFRGDGSMALGGSSFPASPTTNDSYFRTDLGLWFYYDGTRWLSSDVFTAFSDNSMTNLTASTTDVSRMAPLPLLGGTDAWLVAADIGYQVTAGTALSGSHKWVVDWKTATTDAFSTTTLYTKTIDSGAEGTWRRDAPAAIGALLSNPNTFFLHAATKTGTPGNLYFYAAYTYRVVAT